MLKLLKSRVVIALVGALLVGGTAGTLAMIDATNHSGMFAPGGIFGRNQSIATSTPADHGQHAQGTQTPEPGHGTGTPGSGD